MRKHNGKHLYGIQKILTTMLSFGNILERSIYKIWEETSKHFCTLGPACYANISNDVIFSKKKAEWPEKTSNP